MGTQEIQEKIKPLLSEYGVSYVGLFGSVARGEDTPESDVDLLVSIDHPIGVYDFMELRDRLSTALGRRVDLVSRDAVNKHVQPFIEQDLVAIYEQG